MPTLIKLELEDGAEPMKRLMLKNVANQDELEQVYYTLKALVEDQGGCQVEIWVKE